jgi:2,5-diketo-D-gluconate reductase A
MSVAPAIPLLDGTQLPALGFGSPSVDPARGEQLFLDALTAGYRLFDTAQSYGNVLGSALKRTDIPRDEIVVQTKILGRNQGYDSTFRAVDESLEQLELDYIDIYMVHWPNPAYDLYVETWKAMIELRAQGLIRSLGVCNFTDEYLDRLVEETGVAAVVNQIERHPLFPNTGQVRLNANRGIVTESWSSFGRGNSFMADPAIARVAEAHGVSAGQAVLRWHIQGGSVPISYSTKPQRIRENLDVFGFELSRSEMDLLSALESGRLWGQDPRDSNYLE